MERELPGITMEALTAAQRAAMVTSQQFSAAGTPVRYLRSTFVRDEGRCLCLFEAPDPVTVREVKKAARLSFATIVEALDPRPWEPGR